MHEDMSNYLTPETVKEMGKLYSSSVFKKATAAAVLFIAALVVVSVLTGCATTPTVEQNHCGNSVQKILCKGQM